MTPDEFEFWQKAYLAALNGAADAPDRDSIRQAASAQVLADFAATDYRTAKATVVNKVYAVEND